MTVATVVNAEPTRHALVLPECACGMCAPTWARKRARSKRFSAPVTLVAALGAEDAGCRAGMVERHRECLSSMVGAVDALVAATAIDDLGRPETGLTLVMFAGELALALRADQFGPELPAELVAACEQTVTAAMLAAAGCVAGMLSAAQVLADLIG